MAVTGIDFQENVRKYLVEKFVNEFHAVHPTVIVQYENIEYDPQQTQKPQTVILVRDYPMLRRPSAVGEKTSRYDVRC